MQKQLTIQDFIEQEYNFDIRHKKTAQIILSDEHWYQQFLTYFHNFSFEFGHKHDKIRKLHIFRTYKMMCLQMTKEQFIQQYQKDPIEAIQYLFQEHVSESDYKLFKRYEDSESFTLLYDIVQLVPTESFIKCCVFSSLQTAYDLSVSWSKIESYQEDQNDLKRTLENFSPSNKKVTDSIQNKEEKQRTIEEFIQKEYSFEIKHEKTARLVLSDEYWYQQFLTYFHNFSFGYGYQFEKMMKLQTFRAYKIKCLQVSKEHFIKRYKTEPILALEELFQESIHASQEKMLHKFKNESIGILYDAMQVAPAKRFIKFTTGPSLQYAYESAVEERELKIGNQERNQEYLRMVLAGHIIKKEKQKFVIIKREKETKAKPISKQNKQTKEVSMTKWVRNSTLAKSLKELYAHTCQCCGKSFPSRTGYLSEAHHVQPYNETHKGDDAWENMIVVCPTCHGWFDDFYFAIHPETMVLHCYDQNHPLHGTLFQTQEGHVLDTAYLQYAWAMFSKEDSKQHVYS